MIGPILRQWRGIRGMSQLELANEAAVSARHVSFMESGRSRPSPEMVARLAEALGLPLRDRNAMMMAAGFAPRFGESDWDSPELAEIRAAARLILSNHDPHPAIVLDGSFTVLDGNAGAWALLGSGVRPEILPNLIDLVFSPGPLRAGIGNWPEVAAYLLHRLREGTRLRGMHSAVGKKYRQALASPGVAELSALPSGAEASVLLPVIFTRDGVTTRWFTTVTSFGAPQDALAEEIVIEQFHPA